MTLSHTHVTLLRETNVHQSLNTFTFKQIVPQLQCKLRQPPTDSLGFDAPLCSQVHMTACTWSIFHVNHAVSNYTASVKAPISLFFCTIGLISSVYY